MTEAISPPRPEKEVAPFEIVELPPEVFKTYDDEQVADLLVSELEARKIDPDSVIFSGFDGKDYDEPGMLNGHTFGSRSSTWGVSRTQMMRAIEQGDERRNESPLAYLDVGVTAPVIAAFDVNKLLGADSDKTPREHMDKFDARSLQTGHEDTFWVTRDDSSLDTATRVLFVLHKQ